MKKLLVYIMAGFLLLTFTPTQLPAATAAVLPPEVSTATAQSVNGQRLTLRLEEINALDKSKMGSSEKKALRKEARAIKHELKALSGGVYISAATLVIILILLIVLL